MSVYVDGARHKLGRMLMCHMLADSVTELHAMADRIGIARRHFQLDGRWPHYDICKSKRALAISYGAIEMDSADMMRMFKARGGPKSIEP